MSFPIVAPISAGFAQAASVLKASGKKKVVAAIIDIPQTGALATAVQASAAKAGVAYDAVKIPPTTTDFSAVVAQIKAKGADSVLLLLNDTISVGLMQTANQLGFNPTWAETDGVLSNKEISGLGPIAEGMVVLSATPSVYDTSNQGVVKYNAEMDAAAKAGVKNADVRANITLNSWMSVYATVAVMKTITGPITHDSLLAALNTATNVDTQGIVPPWSPSKPLNTPPYIRATGGWLYDNVVKNGKIAPSGNPPVNSFAG
jgi:ABC-type branched-subunit amino acid transport system substrate-binding protein